eukprot:symbB.v1.2.020471.t1/scaffold1729.1/size181395/8
MARCAMKSNNAPVKNTFIHFSDSEEEATGVRRRNSEPALCLALCADGPDAYKEWKNSLWPMLLATASPVVSSFSRKMDADVVNPASSEDTARRQKRSCQRKARAVRRAVANQVFQGGSAASTGSDSG